MIAACALSLAVLVAPHPKHAAPSPIPVATAARERVDPVARETKRLVDATSDLVHGTRFLGWATFAAVIAAIVIPIGIEVLRRIDDRNDRRDRGDAARKQLIVFLTQYEEVAANLVADPRQSVAPRAEALRPLFERALSLEVATAIRPDNRSQVYTALAVAQLMMVDAAVRQQQFQHQLLALRREASSAREPLAKGLDLTTKISEQELQISTMPLGSARKRLQADVARLRAEQIEHNASFAYTTATKFQETKDSRLTKMYGLPTLIQSNAANARRDLGLARAALVTASKLKPDTSEPSEPGPAPGGNDVP